MDSAGQYSDTDKYIESLRQMSEVKRDVTKILIAFRVYLTEYKKLKGNNETEVRVFEVMKSSDFSGWFFRASRILKDLSTGEWQEILGLIQNFRPEILIPIILRHVETPEELASGATITILNAYIAKLENEA